MSAPTPAAPSSACPLCKVDRACSHCVETLGLCTWCGTTRQRFHHSADCAQIAAQARLIAERDAEIARLRAELAAWELACEDAGGQ